MRWSEFVWLRNGIVFCECGNTHLGSLRGYKFLEQLNDYQIPSSDSSPWPSVRYFISRFVCQAADADTSAALCGGLLYLQGVQAVGQ